MPLYLGGMPTNIDIEKIHQAIGTPNIGDTIRYEQLEQILGLKRDAYRFKTVIQQWRKKLDRDSNIILGAVRGVGFEVLNPSGRVDHGSRTHKKGLRAINRAAMVAIRTTDDGLDASEIKTRDYLINTAATIRMAAATSAKVIFPKSQK